MTESIFQTIQPTKPVAPWVGGKSRLAKQIISKIEEIPHVSYAEAFVGMGGIFLRRTKVPKAEVINDYSKDVANLFRILQRHYQAFLEMLCWQLCTRADFIRLIDTNPETLTDLERAARFLYLQRTCFGGKVSGKNFGVSRGTPSRFDLSKLEPMLSDVHERLTSVVVECLPFQDFIKRYDTSQTLFYLDPPYFGCEDYYGKELFSRGDFEVLADVLSNVKARFILSINDTPEIREIFSEFNTEPVTVRYSVAGGDKQRDFKELIIGN